KPRYKIKLKLKHVVLELGDYILLSHPLVPDLKSPTGALGITSVLCEIIDRQPDYAQGYVEFDVLDGRYMDVTTSYAIAPAGTPDWTGSSAGQRATFMYVSDADGLNSDGSAGNRIW